MLRRSLPCASPARRLMPRTFQGRLTIAFVAVIALTLGLVSVLVLNRLDDYFAQQQTSDLQRALDDRQRVRPVLAANGRRAGEPVVGADGARRRRVVDALERPGAPRVHRRPARPGRRHRSASG